MSKSTVLLPRISEKAYNLSQNSRVYVFQVSDDLNKLQVKQAVEAQFGVTVTNVNSATTGGKRKRTVRKGGRSVMGKRNDVKKAYVTIAEGQEIPVFAEEEKESKSTAPKATKKNKKGAKA